MGAKYYESELAYLREMGREFALVHPSTAGLLAERGNDPDVERLLEGFAFLTARIREKVDDAVPAIVQGITELLLPHFLRPIPATSIIQYSPSIKALRGVQPVARGAKVASTPMQGTSCQFRTTQEVELLPWQIVDAQLDETAAARPVIRLMVDTTEAGRAVVMRREGMRILLHGDMSICATLYLWMRRHLVDVEVRNGGNSTSLGGKVVKPIGWSDDDAVLPWPTFSQPGYRYLQEYFTLPGKFLFLDVVDLHKAGELLDDRIELRFTFDRPPALEGRLTPDNFRLHCTPVINLFEVSGDPLKLDPLIYEHLLRAAGINPKHMEVYEVTDVIGVRQGQTQRRPYHPFFGFAHGGDKLKDAAYYTLRPTPSPIDEGADMYLSVVTPRDVAPSEVEETLSLDLRCTNRSLPAELQLGEISTTPRGTSAAAAFKNISPVTTPVRPPLGSELHWRLLSHLAINRQSLGNAETLRSLLALYNFHKDISQVLGRANELKIESIRTVDSTPITRMMQGAPVRGVQTLIELDESKLGTTGEAFLFGCVLDEVYANHAPLNSFNELRVRLHPSKTMLRWPARSGRQQIL
ncbi:MAG: type VI secretion system baseplate subunit TssF [Deltaproteobacteria bacterium]|nr:type VI secretion system baseplate subunit TssF [Deltaproteobacteria bacterium]